MDELELKKAIAEAAKSAGKSDNGRSAYAEMVIELIEPNHLSLELFNRFMPTTQKNAGDTVVKRIKRGRYPIFTMVPGTSHLTGAVSFQDTYQWMFDRLITGARESLWNLRDNPLVTTESIRTNLQADLVDNLVGRVFDLLSQVWTTALTPNNYTETVALTASQLDALMENVIEKAGNVRGIMGTRRALLPIYNFAGFTEYTVTGGSTPTGFDIPEVVLERYRTNRVATYKGAPLIEVPQVYSFNGADGALRTKLLPDDKIVVVGDNAGEVALFGGFETQDYTDFSIQPADYVLHGWQAYGMMITDVEMIGVIKKLA